MILAYISSEYPKVSHSFIRREITELERRGHTVVRVSIRAGEVTDPADQAELSQTFQCLAQSPASFIGSLLRVGARNPIRLIKAFRIALCSALQGSRGWIRNAAYVAEAAEILRHLQSQKVEHVHAHFGSNAASVARLIQAMGGPTYSIMIHGPLEFDDPMGLEIGPKVCEAAFVTAISSFCSAQVRRWVPYAHWDKIKILHCTVSEDFLDPICPIPAGPPVLVSIGRLSEQKGQLLLLDALAELRQSGNPLHLRLFGDGELRPEIERRISALQLDEWVTLEGWGTAAQLRAALDACSAFVLPSFAEGLPVVLMEAFARGRPALSTTIAGIPELVTHGVNGWLVPAGSRDGIAVALGQIAECDRSTLEEMGRDGRRRVENEFRTTNEIASLEQMFLNQVGKESN